MRLKKLEIKGFKSFADKTKIEFNQNITGIVGPNGCGKSNIVDAIRWVLGEQKTSQLRLEKMENVLFNGSKDRKSTSLAEVSLTFENTKNLLATDFHEVTITRKLYRNGESEYRINDVNCRLKDIHNLFMDIGIGSDSYAIIELGMVDELLQNKDNSRRKLFEQASSVSKYKIRKRESLLKLKNTEEDLTRLEDLLAEIENNLKSLESQARRAERYHQIKDEYRELSVDSIKLQLKTHKSDYDALVLSKTKEEEAKINIDQKLSQEEASLAQQKLILLQSEERLTSIQKTYNEIIKGLGTFENERTQLKEQVANAISQQKQLVEIVEGAIKEKSEIDATLSLISDEVSLLEKESETISLLFETKKVEIDGMEDTFKDQKTSFDQDKKDFQAQQQTVLQLQREVDILSAKQSSIQSQLQQLDIEVKESEAKSQLLNNDFENVERSKADQEAILGQMKLKEDANIAQLNELKTSAQTKKNQLSQELRTLDSKRNEYSLLKSMIDNLEGFPESIKFLKRNNKSLTNTPLFSEIINCKEEYRIAIENVVAPYLNYFVVDTVAEAQRAIEMLRETSNGKSSFFIMELIKKAPVSSFEIVPGLMSALEVVQVDAPYRKLIQLLLGNCYICDSSFDFVQYQSKNIQVITKDGTQSMHHHGVTGGSANLFDGAQVGRTKNLEALKEEIAKLESIYQTLDKETKAMDTKMESLQKQSLQLEIVQLEKELNLLVNEYTKLKTQIDQTKELADAQEKKRLQWLDDAKVIEIRYKELTEDIASKSILVESLKEKIEEKDKDFVLESENLQKAKEAFIKIQLDFQNQATLLKQKTEQRQFYENRLAVLSQQEQSNQSKIKELEKEEQNKATALKKLESDILNQYSDRTQLEKEIETAEKSYYEMRAIIGDAEKTIKDQQKAKDTLLEIIAALDSKIQEMKMSLLSTKERLSIEFNLDINELLNSDLNINKSKEELETKLAHIKKKLETYGDVNPMAIESFNEMKSRYDFLVGQRNDIVESKNNLLSTIKEIDETAKERFLESFVNVRENFIKTFRTLFTEDDDCDLILVDPDHPLESDIDIIAKPKGKKPLTINQLSGGEKTLTATALLFSLYLLKPAPFCIFDEVDAPLDDTNIAKFNKIINQFSDNSQFIIVTHNKQTMASVEVIYGVTMVEQGVSKVVPVDFRALQEG
jgi:chromosome segregation protein